MAQDNSNRQQAFTLVELIVVIAVLGILLAVLVPSFNGYIERGRRSNDVQVAQSLTTIIRNHRTLNSQNDYDAHDIREIIRAHYDEDFDFTPLSSGTGFFYLSTSNRIIVCGYEDISEYQELQSHQTHLLNMSISDLSMTSRPEEVFGADRILITESGNGVAEIIHFINHMGNYGTAINKTYQYVYDSLDDGFLNTFFGRFRHGMSNGMRERMMELLLQYHPNQTLFVNNVAWVTSAENLEDVVHIVFTPGINNIPDFKLDVDGFIPVEHIVIPRSVRTIQKNAFSNNAFDRSKLTIEIKDNAQVSTLDGALENIEVIYNEPIENIPFQTLIDYSDFIDINDDGIYDLSRLKEVIEGSITGYNIFTVGDYYEILIYTEQGLIGFARNIYTITYHYNHESNSGVFLVERGMNDTFRDTVFDPVIDGYRFTGWCLDEACMIPIKLDDQLESYRTSVYASWEPLN